MSKKTFLFRDMVAKAQLLSRLHFMYRPDTDSWTVVFSECVTAIGDGFESSFLGTGPTHEAAMADLWRDITNLSTKKTALRVGSDTHVLWDDAAEGWRNVVVQRVRARV